MNEYSKYFLISDLDGTLINSGQEISKENLSAIKHFIDNGGIFSVATGRTNQTDRLHIKELPINGPCVLYNGSGVYDLNKEQFFCTEYLEKSRLVEYVEYCIHRFGSMIVEVFSTDMMYIVTPEENVEPYVMLEKQVFKHAALKDILHTDWIKIMFSDTPENLSEAAKELKTFGLEELVDSVFSHQQYFEILKKSVSKGSALEYIRQMEEYKDRVFIAVGDYDNDIEMVRAADFGVAVENAREGVKQAADKITVNNDQHAIHDIIYNILPGLCKECNK